MFLIIGVSGCIFNSDDSGDEKETVLYLPLKVGAQYTYSVIETDLPGTVINTYEKTTTISGTVTINEQQYWGFSSDVGDGMMFRAVEDTVYSYIGFGDDGIDPSGVEIVFFRFDAALGSSWESSPLTFFDPQHNADVSMTWKGTYIGTENVTVPAGSFDNCKKYDIRIPAVIHTEVPVEALHFKILIWLAPNVGMVKTLETIYTEGRESGFMDSQLTSYTIP